jgi:hypothetical protein
MLLFSFCTSTGIGDVFVLLFPSWPKLFAPRHRIFPLSDNAQVKSRHISIAINVVLTGILIATGVVVLLVLLFQRRQFAPFHRHRTLPFISTAQVCCTQAEISIKVLFQATSTGVFVQVSELFPNCPYPLSHRHRALLLLSIVHVWYSPALILVYCSFANHEILTGIAVQLLLLVPSCPKLLSHRHHASQFVSSAQVWRFHHDILLNREEYVSILPSPQ